jgi:hypothetical protein
VFAEQAIQYFKELKIEGFLPDGIGILISFRENP